MKTSGTRLIQSIVATVLVSSNATFAGMPDAAGTLVGDKANNTGDILTLLGLAVAAVVVVLYLRRRKAK